MSRRPPAGNRRQPRKRVRAFRFQLSKWFFRRICPATVVSNAVNHRAGEPESVSEADADRYRIEAEECRRLADKARNPVDKEAWLRLASEWLKLAEDAAALRRP